MADDNTPPEGGHTGDTGGEFKPITSQDELNRVIGDRVARERAKFADYDDLKARASTAAEWEKKATELEAKVPALTAASLRDAVLTLGVVPDTRKVLLTASDPAGLLEQVKAIRDIENTTPPPGGRRATPPGKPAGEDGKGRAAAALRELRGAST